VLCDASNDLRGIADTTDELVLGVPLAGLETPDSKYVTLVTERARHISSLFERAVADGEITAEALFDRDYQPIPDTNPEQVVTGFTEFTDRVLTPVQEPILEQDDSIVYCAAVDENGYLPTHNLKFSKPQGDDPTWNTANCRNRRIFDDRAGLRAAKNEKPVLLQTYRRDMGGGKFVVMKEVDAPIHVNGRRWGTLRLAYKL
jgi:methyl-accepting chemotaxis protein